MKYKKFFIKKKILQRIEKFFPKILRGYENKNLIVIGI